MRILILGVGLLTAWSLRAAPGCTVSQQEFRSLLTVRFTVDERIAQLTIPSVFAEGDRATALVESPAEHEASDDDLFIEAGQGKAAFRRGAPLLVKREKGKRLTFSVVNRGGDPVCSWDAPILAQQHGPYYPGPGVTFRDLDPVSRRMFQRIGEPVVWVLPNVPVRDTEEFTIDGQRMALLTIAPHEVYLRDPAPKPGLRRLQGAGFDTTYRFIDPRIRVRQPQAKRTVLDIEVAGLEGLQHRTGMILINRSQDKVRLLCGHYPSGYKEWNRGHDREEIKWMEFEPREVRSGTYRYSCPVEIVPGTEPVIDVNMLERRPMPTIRLLPRL